MIRALAIVGGWDGHQPGKCVSLLEPALRSAGVELTISERLDVLDERAGLERYDVVVPCWTMGVLSGPQEQHLCGAVAGGVGLAGWHGGMGDAFRSNTEYQFMVGGQFVAHPGNHVDYVVRIRDRAHPITAGLEDFAVRSEQYYMHVDPGVHVLADTVFAGAAAPWVKGVVMPVVWTKAYGSGRVAYCSIGHGPEDLMAPPVPEIVQRCVVWAARRH
jgi:type 1 glutamine amidotransferase